MNKDIEELIDILEYIDKIEIYASESSNAKEFYKNRDYFNATIMNIVKIAEAGSRISSEMQNSYRYVEWAEIKELQNITSNDDAVKGGQEVWQIVHGSIAQLKNSIKHILQS